MIGRILFSAGLVVLAGDALAFYPFPNLPPPEEFGNVIISRTSAQNSVKPASFSHWVHRRKFTCRVCHFELEFEMKANATEITEEDNRNGRFCGACHDGVKLFGHKDPEACANCHNGDIRAGADRFSELFAFPQDRHGNMIDWTEAWEAGLIDPKNQLTIPPFDNLTFREDLSLESECDKVFEVTIFPHGEHIKWLDCNICHPFLFNIKKKFTTGFNMYMNYKGEFCGSCHLRVAFPLADCKRCHTTMKKVPVYEQPKGLR
jgi:c(7)-type cytochrome triheme protein